MQRRAPLRRRGGRGPPRSSPTGPPRRRLPGCREVWVDPGIGFGKTSDHNLSLLAHLGDLAGDAVARATGCWSAPAASGSSGSLGPGRRPAAPVDERLEASLATAVWAMARGAGMVRVHDVAPTVQAAALVGPAPRPRPHRRTGGGVRGKWAAGIPPRNFTWVIRDRLAVSERPGGFAPNHRRVRRQEEIIWLRVQGFTRVVSLLPSAAQPPGLRRRGDGLVPLPPGPRRRPRPVLADFYRDLDGSLAAGMRVLVHQDELGDRVMGVVAGFLVWSGRLPLGPPGHRAGRAGGRATRWGRAAGSWWRSSRRCRHVGPSAPDRRRAPTGTPGPTGVGGVRAGDASSCGACGCSAPTGCCAEERQRRPALLARPRLWARPRPCRGQRRPGRHRRLRRAGRPWPPPWWPVPPAGCWRRWPTRVAERRARARRPRSTGGGHRAQAPPAGARRRGDVGVRRTGGVRAPAGPQARRHRWAARPPAARPAGLPRSRVEHRRPGPAPAAAVGRPAGRGDVVAVSPLYETEPVGGPEGQGRYLNLVVELTTTDTPPATARALPRARGDRRPGAHGPLRAPDPRRRRAAGRRRAGGRARPGGPPPPDVGAAVRGGAVDRPGARAGRRPAPWPALVGRSVWVGWVHWTDGCSSDH